MVVRVNLRGKTASGKLNKTFYSTGVQIPIVPKPLNDPSIAGAGFKTLKSGIDDKLSKLNIDTNKKLNKFISFKL